MNTFQQHIRGKQSIFITYIDYSRIVANALGSVGQANFRLLIYSSDQPEFSQAADFCSCFHAAKLSKKAKPPRWEVASLILLSNAVLLMD